MSCHLWRVTLVAVSLISNAATITTLSMALMGLLLGCVGTDLDSGVQRLSMGLPNLSEGINIVALVVGLFAFSQIILRLTDASSLQLAARSVTGLLPTGEDIKRIWKPIVRGTALGSILGIFPGTGPLISSFASYAMEKRMAKNPAEFGYGAIEGVAGPEAANNAAALTHFIPMLTLGIPAGPAMALLLAALKIQGISPGPEFVNQHADVFWGVVASMLIGNAMLLFLNLPLIGIWVRMLTIPYRFLYPFIVLSCCVGVYAISSQFLDVIMAAVIALVGIVCSRIKCPPEPLLLGFILEPVLEDNFRRALLLSRGSLFVFVDRPISLAILLISVALIITLSAPAVRLRISRAVKSPARQSQ